MNHLASIRNNAFLGAKIIAGKAVIILLFAFLIAGSPKSILPVFDQTDHTMLVEHTGDTVTDNYLDY